MTDLRERSVEAVLKASASWSMELNAGEAAELVDAVADMLLVPTAEALKAAWREADPDADAEGVTMEVDAAFTAQRAQVRGGKDG